jgi:F-type H+-transporting ATPase subunit delta
MAESITLARPYAKAAFEVALAGKELGAWSNALQLLAKVSANELVRRRLLSPSLTAVQQADTLIQLCGDEEHSMQQLNPSEH